jgi:hypothetical protein
MAAILIATKAARQAASLDLGEDYFDRRDIEHAKQQLVKRLVKGSNSALRCS